MDEELERARRYQHDVALLMVDLDGFKAVNDSFGHVVGDAALQRVAQVLQRTVRKFDVCARYGGDEFAILLPGSDTARALQSAERIRRRVELSQPEAIPPGSGLRLTASIGVATRGAGAGGAALIVEADRALYEAKGAGGNCVRIATPEVASP
jgi:diguanylate cyclase (GGDEF)-like protein